MVFHSPDGILEKAKIAPRPVGRPASFGGPGAGPGPPPGDGHRHRKTVTRKSSPENRHLKAFGTVWGSFWPKLVKSSAFKPKGRHEQFRSALFIGKSSVGCSKALTRTPFVTNRADLLLARPTSSEAGQTWLCRPGRPGRADLLLARPTSSEPTSIEWSVILSVSGWF